MKFYVLLQILIIFVLPIGLLYFNIIKKKYRLALLFLSSILVLGIVFIEKIPAHSLGIRTDNLVSSILPYIIFTALALVAILLLALFLHRKPSANWKKDPHFLYLFIPISFLQEFLYRGFLFPKLSSISTNFFWIILANTVLFALLHIIYNNRRINVLFASVAGLSFALMYYFSPNLILISISHAILNFFAVLFGFFSDNSKISTAR